MIGQNTINVERSDLIFLLRAIDSAYAEVEAAVSDGDVDESVVLDLEDALELVKEYLDK
jgi:hypothetical protein